MAVVSVKRLFGDKATISKSRTESWRFLVEVDDPTTTASEVFAGDVDGVAVARKGTTYVIDGRIMYCESVDAQQDVDNPHFWEVTANIANITTTGSEKSKVNIAVSGSKYEEDITKDFSSPPKPIVNSAGQPFDPSVVKTYRDTVITVRYRTNSPDVNNLDDLRGMVASNAISLTISRLNYYKTWAAGTIMFDDARYSTSVTTDDDNGDDPYWEVELDLIYRKDGWIRKVLNQGYYTWNALGKRELILDENDQPLNAPALLDATGALLAKDAEATFQSFKVDEETAAIATLLSGIS